jgi:hypothetical protein
MRHRARSRFVAVLPATGAMPGAAALRPIAGKPGATRMRELAQRGVASPQQRRTEERASHTAR